MYVYQKTGKIYVSIQQPASIFGKRVRASRIVLDSLLLFLTDVYGRGEKRRASRASAPRGSN